MIAIIDYGLGNVQAFKDVYNRLNVPVLIARSSKDLVNVTKLILPGVGSFDYAITKLDESGMRKNIEDLVIDKKIPILGAAGAAGGQPTRCACWAAATPCPSGPRTSCATPGETGSATWWTRWRPRASGTGAGSCGPATAAAGRAGGRSASGSRRKSWPTAAGGRRRGASPSGFACSSGRTHRCCAERGASPPTPK